MAKISTLPQVAADETTTVPVVHHGATGRTNLLAAILASTGLTRARLPGTAFALYLPETEQVPFRISENYEEIHLGTTRISHQFRPAMVPSRIGGHDYLALSDEQGRGLILRHQPPPVDPYADDAARYAGAIRRPFEVQPVFTAMSAKMAAFTVGYEQGVMAFTRIPSLATDRKGLVFAYCEGRTTLLDGDPKGIVRRLSRYYGRAGSWEAQKLIASDFAVTGADAVLRDNSFGSPSSVYDPVTGRVIVLVYWRRQDIASAGGLVAPTTDPERTSRILAFADDGTNLYDLAGTNLGAGPITRAQMTDVTTAKPQTWGAGTPGPAQGLAHSSGDLYWTIHGTEVGNTGGRQIQLVKLDRASGTIVPVSLSPRSTAEPNETSMCELSDGRIMLSSRVDAGATNDNRIRQLAVYDPVANAWDIPRMQVNLPDPQKAGAMCNITRGPFEPSVILHANVAMHQTSQQDTLRNLTVRASWDNGYTWPVGRRVYDSAPDGTMVRRTDSWGKPVVNAAGLDTSVNWHAMTGYSSMVEIAPGTVAILFETRGLFYDGSASLGFCGFTTFTLSDLMEPRRD